MATRVTITGTGVPPASPGRAGAGVLIQHGETALQFDAGRATTLRLAEAGIRSDQLDAVFVTHHHSDHVVGIVDIVFCAWLARPVGSDVHFVAPNGPSTRFLGRMLEPYDDDIAIRMEHTGRAAPAPMIDGFDATSEPIEVWSKDAVRVLARAVDHHPVDPAVAYRIETPDGSVVISGDTTICDGVAAWAADCDVLVHEAFNVDQFVQRANDDSARVIGDYHTDSRELGAMAATAGPGLLMVTHMVPPPRNEAEKQAFFDDVRRGGYTGELIVCDDLDHVEF